MLSSYHIFFFILIEWLRQRGESVYFEDMVPRQLNSLLGDFYQYSARFGTLPESLQSFPYEMSRYLSSPPFNRCLNIDGNSDFFSSCTILRSLCQNYEIGSMRPISQEDLQLLYKSPCMSADTPESLQNKVWIDVNLYFGVLSRKMLRQLEKKSFVLEMDYNNDRRYYRIADPRVPKDRHLSRMYEQPGNPLCPVQSMLLYYSRLNPGIDAFFQQPDKTGSTPIWYHPTPVGKNVHSGKLSTICRQCGIKIYYRNLALRSVYRSVHSRAPDYTYDFSRSIIEMISGSRSDDQTFNTPYILV